MTTGPFAMHPASPAELDRLAGRLTSYGTLLHGVGGAVSGRGRRADSESSGLSGGIQLAVRPAATAGTSLREAGTRAGLAVSAWAAAVGVYNESMRDLNELWRIAAADGFGVADLEIGAGTSASDAEQARSDHGERVAVARGGFYATLLRMQQASTEALDRSAGGVSAMLGGGSAAPGVTLVGWSADGTPPPGPPYDFRGWAVDQQHRTYSEMAGQEPYRDYDGPWWPAEVLKFLLMDPGECAGENSSGGGCGLEIAALLPFTKLLKGLKLAKLFKHVDDVPAPPKVHPGKQGKHDPSHPNYQPGKSILEADPNELAKSAGTGTPVGKVPLGDPGSKEIVDYGRRIGTYVDPKTGEALETTRATIHYAKDGTIHIVPAYPK